MSNIQIKYAILEKDGDITIILFSEAQRR